MEQTKLRLIREAVQDNVHHERRSRTRADPVERSPKARAWLGGLGVIATLAVLPLLSPFAFPPGASTEGIPGLAAAASEGPGSVDVLLVDESMETASTAAPGALPGPGAPPEPLDPALFPLKVETIVIDAGHGGSDTGAISKSGAFEKEIALDIALQLRTLLEEDSFEVLMTRETDRRVGLDERARFANDRGADLFVSIHINWMEYPDLQPLETYFLGPSDDPEATRLVAMENSDPGYSLNDYRFLLEKIYVDARRGESRRLAETVQRELHGALSRINPTIDDRGVKMAPFAVLIRTEMPAILAEVSSLSNEEDVRLLKTAEYKESIAQALSRAVRSYADSLAGASRKVAHHGK